MTFLEQALLLAEHGFHVFPLIENSKLPLIDRWQIRATRDAEQIRRWWTDPVLGTEQPFNIGICTTRYAESGALVVVDVDNKGDKHGNDEVIKNEIEGRYFPDTYTQITPSGGRHFVYVTSAPVKQGVSVLGSGLDIRSRGGFIVAAGSVVPLGRYVAEVRPLASCPKWIIDCCGVVAQASKANAGKPVARIDSERAEKRAVNYLLTEAPHAAHGERNALGFKAAARLKDFGVTQGDAYSLMFEYWRCEPMIDQAELFAVVQSAYRYGTERPGAAAPEADFAVIEVEPKASHPFEELNKQFAFVVTGGGHHILWETTDTLGRYKLEHLNEYAFHRMHAAQMLTIGRKPEPVTELWMRDPARRSYKGICFMPKQQAPPHWYNLWRGFSVEPTREAPPAALKAVADWHEHLLLNVCGNDVDQAKWLLQYFAHMAQRPWEKPLCALVFKGDKGVGKNALIELGIHGLLEAHSLIVTDGRYLVGNFNGHLENLLMLTFDEAFWSGDKRAEGRLKGLITGAKHVIEHKGKEPYTIDNKCRVVILGNEDWLVPAGHDERRFAVFNVGDGRKQDRDFFEGMRKGMVAGGFGRLLGQLLDVDLSGFHFNAAPPATAALLEQKHESLNAFNQWWLECLTEGWIVGSDFGGQWLREIDKTRLRAAFQRYTKDLRMGGYLPSEESFGRKLKQCAPSVSTKGKRRDGDMVINMYTFGNLDTHRREWSNYIGHKVEWD